MNAFCLGLMHKFCAALLKHNALQIVQKCETSENNGLILCVYAQVLCNTYIHIPCTFQPKLVFIVLMQLESSI